MKKILLLVAGLWICQAVEAQQSTGKVNVIVTNDQKTPVEGATIELLRKDSALVKTAISDKAGKAELEPVPFNTYMLRISNLNHATTYSVIFTLDSSRPSFSLLPKNLSFKNYRTAL